MKTTRSRITEKVVVTHVTAIAPTARLLVISVDAAPDEKGDIETETFTLPVVSIRTTVTDVWARHELGDEMDEREYADADELREARYQFCRQQLDDELLVRCPVMGDSLISLADLRRAWRFKCQVVTATWELRDDEQRFEPIVEKFVGCVKQAAQRHIAKGTVS